MALIEHDLLGNRIDKAFAAIQRLKAFEPPEGYYMAFSGGKDSVVLKALADEAGVNYDAHYNATTVDPPELVRFIRERHPDVEIVKPDIPMRKLIPQKKMPPTRLVRYCCSHYKEGHGEGRVTLTGVRWAESRNRKDNQGAVTIIGASAKDLAEGTTYHRTGKGGIVMNYDDAETRRSVETCYRTHKTLVNPIIDWTDEDVWEYIKTRNLPYCSLYDEGFTRLGCVGCPLGGDAAMRRELSRWPAIRKVYISAFDDMIKARKDAGMPCTWKNGEEVMRWWTREKADTQLDGQMTMFDEEEHA